MKFGLIVPYIAMLLGLYIFHSGWIAFLIYHLLILLVMLRTNNLKHWKFRGWNTKIGILAILFGLAGGLVIYLLEPFVGLKSYIAPALAELGLSGNAWLFFVIYHFAANPWFEESYWRGMYGSKKKRLVTSDFFFSGYHLLVLALFLEWYWLILAFVLLLLAAWFWRQLATRYNGLLLPTISHMAADASIMVLVYLLSI